MFYIMPYKLGSDSAKALAQGLNVLRINGKKFLGKRDVVINWGNSEVVPKSRWGNVRTINSPNAVAKASNKIDTFIELTKKGIVTVPWTTSSPHAQGWLQSDDVVVARTYVNGSQGRGIRIITGDDTTFPNAALYTKYVPKCHEYRVHVMFGEVIDFSKKKRKEGVEVSEFIRNHSNGWVFCKDGAVLPDKVAKLSIEAVNALGLDFGALDVLYKERDDKAYILEINSAPGIEGSTLNKYIDNFKRRLLC